jgi:hypothetical protein
MTLGRLGKAQLLVLPNLNFTYILLLSKESIPLYRDDSVHRCWFKLEEVTTTRVWVSSWDDGNTLELHSDEDVQAAEYTGKY